MISIVEVKEFAIEIVEAFWATIVAVIVAAICIVAGFPWLGVIACIIVLGLGRYWYSCVFGLGNVGFVLCVLLFSFLCCFKDYKEIAHDIYTSGREKNLN